MYTWLMADDVWVGPVTVTTMSCHLSLPYAVQALCGTAAWACRTLVSITQSGDTAGLQQHCCNSHRCNHSWVAA
jgi:hypothetical protein